MTDTAIVAFIVDRFEARPGTAPDRGFVNHPDDRGKATNWGVTAARLGQARGLARPATVEEVRALSREEAIAILLEHYVVRVRFEAIENWRLRFAVVDYGINSGEVHAARVLQRVLGVRSDGVIGPVTLAAVNGLDREGARRVGARHVADRVRLVGQLVTRRPNQFKFGEGWCNRIATVIETVTA
jgi:lysozyme family protein